MTHALFVGDASWDTTVLAPAMPSPDEKVFADRSVDCAGGVASNAAVACHLAGADVALVTVAAEDPAGLAVTGALAAYGIDLRVQTTPGVTSRAIVILDYHGEKRLFLAPGDLMYPEPEFLASVAVEDFGWVHTALYGLGGSAALIDRCRASNIPWSIDLEPATIPADLGLLSDQLRGCRTVIVNARAVECLGESAVPLLYDLGADEVLETLGPDGARLHRPGQATLWMRPSYGRRPVVDTTGAGDALAGWLVAERLAGSPIELALDRAVNAASHSVGALGSSVSYSSRADVLALTMNTRISERPAE